MPAYVRCQLEKQLLLNEENLNPAQFTRLLWIFSSKQISSGFYSFINNTGYLYLTILDTICLTVAREHLKCQPEAKEFGTTYSGKKEKEIYPISRVSGSTIVDHIFNLQRLPQLHPKTESHSTLPTEELVTSSKQLVDEFFDEGGSCAKPGYTDTSEAVTAKGSRREPNGCLPNSKGTQRKGLANKYIFQRHTPVPSEPAGHEESSSLYAELGLSGSDTESDEEMPSVAQQEIRRRKSSKILHRLRLGSHLHRTPPLPPSGASGGFWAQPRASIFFKLLPLTTSRPYTLFREDRLYSGTCLDIPSSNLPVPTNNCASALKTTYVPPPGNLLLAQTSDIATFMDCSSPVPDGRMHSFSLDKVDDAILSTVRQSHFHLVVEPEECSGNHCDVWNLSLVVSKTMILLHSSSYEGDRRDVRTHHAYLMCRSNRSLLYVIVLLLKKIILRRADLKEYVIAERDFKYMYPSDFEDLYLLNLQGHLNHLSPDDKKLPDAVVKYVTKPPNWDATGFKFKHDYTVIDSPRAVTFRDGYRSNMKIRADVKTQILDEERRCQKQGVHVRYPETAKDTTYLPELESCVVWRIPEGGLPVTEENRMRGSISYMLM
ncbi:hypothetical protein Tco_0713084 [Tanacetum coccineum]